MKNLISGFLLLLLAGASNAQSKEDQQAARTLPQAFCEAWAKHDGRELAKIMADDVDFVTVATTYLHGRSDFEKFHVRLLSGRFKEAMITPLQTTVRFRHPDMAVVHWSWKIEGDKNPDGTPRQPRYGMMTMVAEKRSGTWLVVVGQNTNAILGIPPELQDIKTPIAIPGTAPQPH
jgi:uncharacterized protein (TIGR02246 family)